MVYVRNRGAYILGTAWQRPLEVMTWTLIAPEAPKTQALKKKRRL